MTIITRPVKTGGGTSYVAGNDLLAQEANDDITTVYSDYNGNITNANCSASMGLEGTKLADAPSGVPTVKINDNAVTTPKIQDFAVTAIKVADNSLSLFKFKNLVIEEKALTIAATPVGTLKSQMTLLQKVNGVNIDIIMAVGLEMLGNAYTRNSDVTIIPVISIPIATKSIISLSFIIDTGTWGTNGVITGRVIIISIDKT